MAIEKDLVCGKDVDTETILTSPATRWIHEGQRYYFCSLQCRNKFLANPDQFLAPTKS